MKKIFIFIILLFILVPLFSDIILNHEQPINMVVGKSVILDLEIRVGFSEVESVTIFFRQAGKTVYSEKEMEAGSESNPSFSSVMSEFDGYSSNAEYYFEVQSEVGNIITHPSIQPTMNPLRISVYTPPNESDGFVLLSPDAAFSDVTENFLIAISIFAISDEIEHNSIQVFFDGEDVTFNSRIFTNALTYQASNLKPGDHSYYVKAKLINGRVIESKHWITSVTYKGFELPMDLTGRALLSFRYMNTSHSTIDDSDKSANFLLSLKGSHEWLRFKSKIYLSSLETSSAQAVNKYSLAFYVPHFDLTIGDHAPQMNSFLLSCKNVQGIHTKLDFKSFRLLFTHGNLKRPVDGKVIQDTLIRSGTFKQKNNTLRLEFGNPQKFVMGFGFAKNKDDISSLDEEYYNFNDSLRVSPKDNLVFGTDFRLSIMNQRLVVGSEAALSLFNDNIIDGAISLDDFEEDINLPIDPLDFENIFVINESMVPYKPGMASIALKSYLRLFFYRNLLNISLTKIGSSFNSLSTNYLQKDAIIISFNDNLMLMNNRLVLNFGFNLSSDNVDNTKDNTSTSTAIFTQAMYKPNDEMYFNININTNSSEDGFVPDEDDPVSTAVDIRSTMVGFGTGYYMKMFSYAPTRLSLNFSNSLNKDDANDTFEYYRNNITLSAKTDFEQLPLTTLFAYTFTLNDNSSLVKNELEEYYLIEEASNYNSIFMRGEFDLIESKLKPYIDFRFNFFKGDIDPQAAQMFNIGSSYEIVSNSYISADTGFKMYQNSDDPDSDYSRFNFKMKISQKF